MVGTEVGGRKMLVGVANVVDRDKEEVQRRRAEDGE